METSTENPTPEALDTQDQDLQSSPPTYEAPTYADPIPDIFAQDGAYQPVSEEELRLQREREKRSYNSGFADGQAAAYQQFHRDRVAYYRNLRDAGARVFGRMPDSRPAGEFLASPRQGFWD